MFLRAAKRFKGGKIHYYWSMVENVRVCRRVFRIARGEAEPSKTVARGMRYGYSRDKRFHRDDDRGLPVLNPLQSPCVEQIRQQRAHDADPRRPEENGRRLRDNAH